MLSLERAQQRRALLILACCHILVIASSNYLVQLPFSILGIHATWGAFAFPFVYLATDLTVRIFGSPLARKIIFASMIPALLLSYVVSVVWSQGVYVGVDALLTFNSFFARIALASFSAYLMGQLMDIKVFSRLRQYAAWWVAPLGSMVVGNLVDTFVFFFTAFYASSDAFMADHWVDFFISEYGFKLSVCLVLFLPAYGVLLKYLIRVILSNKESRPLSKRFSND
ncbi:7-cyano-7-deazaguanine/7-aminomethyl-7-deazaguanine transporter [Endozoicomonas montiporae]|uniref:7-cyano-7-deazaguanine/7-aminomethyl-7- deazaguanine transporter n=1 Tax=Endozoicomonas montiporae TaxID=1027273 RepID=UPI0005529F1F|nr:7-cyano-7-deazaguanine/7-aminomethyl-7-deazaguanine transporter [Endozoicomonas montiporae]